MTPATPNDLIGYRLPGGSFTIEAYEDRMLRDVFMARDDAPGQLHIMWAFVALQRSIGITLEELFTLCQASPDLPPLLGETHVELLEPMSAGARYTVTAEIYDVQRKAGRRSGSMDVVRLGAEARGPDGGLVARLVNSYIFPRGET